ncbi:MAG: hypothetical protein AAFR87_16855 [Bacteroidota bacterium]
MPWEDIYGQTEAYLADELSPEEKVEFERKCETDSAFAEEVQMYLRSLSEITLFGQEKLRSELKERFTLGPDSSIPHKNPRPLWPYLAAAIIVLLLGFWFLLPNQQSTIGTQDLYAAYMEEPRIPNFRSTEPDSLSVKWEEALQKFQDSAYTESFTIINSLLQDSSFSLSYGGQASLYAGIALMENERSEEALKFFDQVNSDNPYIDQIQWYRSLALLKGNRLELAIGELQAIAENSQHYKQEEAKEILEELKKP